MKEVIENGVSQLCEKMNYLAPISYLYNTYIYEMDIQKANINILYRQGVLTEKVYQELLMAERLRRQIYIGKLQKDPEITKKLQAGVIEAKRMFFEANNIQDRDVLSIKNDAVYIIGFCPAIQDFDNIHFIPKNVYTGFYRVGFLELYYFYDSIKQIEYLHVKGIKDDLLPLHEGYFLQFLKDLFSIIQQGDIRTAIKVLKEFYLQYISRNLPVGYYRQFDQSSDFRYLVRTALGTGFAVEALGEDQKKFIDISTSLKVLVELQKILSHIYFEKYH